MKHYTGRELFDISNEIKDGMEFKKLGNGFCATALKDGSIFTGTLQEWNDFKKEFPEKLCADDLLQEVL